MRGWLRSMKPWSQQRVLTERQHSSCCGNGGRTTPIRSSASASASASSSSSSSSKPSTAASSRHASALANWCWRAKNVASSAANFC